MTVFKKLFTNPLKLEVGERTVTFNTPGDFEFSLASRTEVPATKIARLVRLEPDALSKEARSIREVERRFVDVIAKSLEQSGNIGYLLREMDTQLFSQDHEWRPIMRALVPQSNEFDEFKKIALIKYVQYLASRQDVLKSLYANKTKDHAAPPDPEVPADPALKQTLIFDVAEPAETDSRDASSPPPKSSLERLPRGETIMLSPAPGDELRLVLSRHRFTLVPGERTYLADENGGDYLLHSGRNVVGRQPGTDVVVDSAYRDVSRRHLIVDINDDGSLALTDLSSHGTFLPTALLHPLLEP